MEIDQDAWARTRRAHDRTSHDLVKEFRALRNVNLTLWGRVTDADLVRTGEHVGAGIAITLGTLLKFRPDTTCAICNRSTVSLFRSSRSSAPS
ncbi:MAG: hypothetical protein ACE10G_05505, partial [Gemmatimonadales bacterium]